MDRRAFLLLLSVLPVLARAGNDTCPRCQGPLVKAGALTRKRSEPSPNLNLWSGSSHGDYWPSFSEDSPICSRCFLAYRAGDQVWVRSSEMRDAFYQRLSAPIYEFPTPETSFVYGRIVYAQSFKGILADQGLTETVAFWCRDVASRAAAFRAYASRTGIDLELERVPSRGGEIYVVATSAVRPTATA